MNWPITLRENCSSLLKFLQLRPKSGPDCIRRVVLEFLPSSQNIDLFWYVQFSQSYCWSFGGVKETAMRSALTIYLPCISWDFLSHPNSLKTSAHLPIHHFFPKITTNTKTEHGSCTYLKHMLFLRSSSLTHSLHSVFLLKHLILVLSSLIFPPFSPFSYTSFLRENYLLGSWMPLDLCWKEVNHCRCPNLAESLKTRAGNPGL